MKHHTLLTSYYLLLITYNLQLTTYYLQLTTYNLQLTTYFLLPPSYLLPPSSFLLLTSYFLLLITSSFLFTICNLSKLSHPLSNVKYRDHCPFTYETKINVNDYKSSKRKNKKIKKCPTQSRFRKCLLTIRK